MVFNIASGFDKYPMRCDSLIHCLKYLIVRINSKWTLLVLWTHLIFVSREQDDVSFNEWNWLFEKCMRMIHDVVMVDLQSGN